MLYYVHLGRITHTLENQYSALSDGICCNILKLLNNFKIFFQLNTTDFSSFLWRVHFILDFKV